jgi:CheY-like chemotaxis protein
VSIKVRGDSDATILMIEDDHCERQAICRAVVKSQCSFSLVFADDGEEALFILSGESDTGVLPCAHLIVLDLNLPGMSGLEFLSELNRIRKDKRSLVFVYSGTQDSSKVKAAYDLGAVGVFSKQAGSEDYNAFVNMLGSYLNFVVFPR